MSDSNIDIIEDSSMVEFASMALNYITERTHERLNEEQRYGLEFVWVSMGSGEVLAYRRANSPMMENFRTFVHAYRKKQLEYIVKKCKNICEWFEGEQTFTEYKDVEEMRACFYTTDLKTKISALLPFTIAREEKMLSALGGPLTLEDDTILTNMATNIQQNFNMCNEELQEYTRYSSELLLLFSCLRSTNVDIVEASNKFDYCVARHYCRSNDISIFGYGKIVSLLDLCQIYNVAQEFLRTIFNVDDLENIKKTKESNNTSSLVLDVSCYKELYAELALFQRVKREERETSLLFSLSQLFTETFVIFPILLGHGEAFNIVLDVVADFYKQELHDIFDNSDISANEAQVKSNALNLDTDLENPQNSVLDKMLLWDAKREKFRLFHVNNICKNKSFFSKLLQQDQEECCVCYDVLSGKEHFTTCSDCSTSICTKHFAQMRKNKCPVCRKYF